MEIWKLVDYEKVNLESSFAIVSILGIWYYHVKIDHLMVILLASVLSLEMGFIAYYSRNIFIRLLASLGLLFFTHRV